MRGHETSHLYINVSCFSDKACNSNTNLIVDGEVRSLTYYETIIQHRVMKETDVSSSVLMAILFIHDLSWVTHLNICMYIMRTGVKMSSNRVLIFQTK
jgi:ABC-type microcin C transport system duplicated ATPase subunit YejF